MDSLLIYQKGGEWQVQKRAPGAKINSRGSKTSALLKMPIGTASDLLSDQPVIQARIQGYKK